MPTLILLKGQPGSGKSTLGRELARELHIALIDKDDARSAFQNLFPAHPEINWNDLSYDVMFNYVETQLKCGNSVLVDCPLARRVLYNRAAELATEYSANIALVECIADDHEVWEKRIVERGQQDAGTMHSHKPATMDDVKSIMERNNGSETWSDSVDVACRLRIETTRQDTLEQVQEVICKLRSYAAM